MDGVTDGPVGDDDPDVGEEGGDHALCADCAVWGRERERLYVTRC